MNDLQLPIGKRLKEARKAKKLSQEDIGKIVGLGKSAVSQIESGINKLSTEYAITISKQIGIDVHWLLTGEGDMLRDDPKQKAGNHIGKISATNTSIGDRNTLNAVPQDISKDDCMKELEVLKAKYEGVVNENTLLKQMVAMLQKGG